MYNPIASDMFGFPESGKPVLKGVTGKVAIDQLQLKAINPNFSTGFLKVTAGSGALSSDTSTYVTASLNTSLYGSYAYGIYQLGGFQLGSGTTSGYVLTADSSGYGSWQPSARGGGYWSADQCACGLGIVGLRDVTYDYSKGIGIYGAGASIGVNIGTYNNVFIDCSSPSIAVGANNCGCDYSFLFGYCNIGNGYNNAFGMYNTLESTSNAFGNANVLACNCSGAYGDCNQSYYSNARMYGNNNCIGGEYGFAIGNGMVAVSYEMAMGNYNPNLYTYYKYLSFEPCCGSYIDLIGATSWIRQGGGCLIGLYGGCSISMPTLPNYDPADTMCKLWVDGSGFVRMGT